MPPGRELPSLVVAHSPEGRREEGHPTVFEEEGRPYALPGGVTVRAHIAGIDVECPGGMRVDGVRVKKATLADRSVVRLDEGRVYVFAWHAPALALRVFRQEDLRGPGEPDRFGWIAVSEAGARFREQWAIASQARGNVLVLGESGTGKGIVARGLHAMSTRADGPLVVCSDGQVPTLEDLLLRADGGTLIVDPVDSLSPEAQARLLHLARTQREDSLAAGGDGAMHVRIVALARSVTGPFADELRVRLDVPLSIPSFRRRLEDVVLVLRARARKLAERAPELVLPFLGEDAEVRLTAAFVEGLLLRIAGGEVFPLDGYLWRAMQESGAARAGPSAVDHVEEEPPSRGQRRSVAPPGDAVHGLGRRLGLPQARAWKEVRVRQVDGHTVLLTVGGTNARCTFVELGLAKDSRDPARAWSVLLAVCEGRGAFRWQDFGASRDTVRKQLDAVKAALRAAFELAEDPFEDFSARRGWVARFLAVPAR